MLTHPAENTWLAHHVIREIDGTPYLLVRVTVTGRFTERAADPVVRLVGQSTADSWFTEISADGVQLWAYFKDRVPRVGHVELGYPGEAPRRLPMRWEDRAIVRLDHKRLAAGPAHG
jgi:hypothetical protein